MQVRDTGATWTGRHRPWCLRSVPLSLSLLPSPQCIFYLDAPGRGLEAARAPVAHPAHFAGAGRVGRKVAGRAVDGIGRFGVEPVKLGGDGRRDFLEWCVCVWR